MSCSVPPVPPVFALQCLTGCADCRSDLQCTRPKLIAMEPSRLKSWEGEWAFWGAPGMHVLSYTGSTAARAAIHEFELFLAPGCLDGKAPKRLKDDLTSKVRHAWKQARMSTMSCRKDLVADVMLQLSCIWQLHQSGAPGVWYFLAYCNLTITDCYGEALLHLASSSLSLWASACHVEVVPKASSHAQILKTLCWVDCCVVWPC